jgi:membrane-associated phospholipid phosphatase
MMTTRQGTVRPGEVIAVAAGATVLAGSWVVVTATETIPDLERRWFAAVNGLPDGLWPLVWLPMQIGSYGGSLAVVAATGALTRDPRLTGTVLIGSQAAYWAAKAVKHVVSRGRPEMFIGGMRRRERTSGFGYVSGHAGVATALGAALGPSLSPAWAPVLAGAATHVALGRIYAGAHLPLDVVGGVGVGLLTGTLSRWCLGRRVGGPQARRHHPALR